MDITQSKWCFIITTNSLKGKLSHFESHFIQIDWRVWWRRGLALAGKSLRNQKREFGWWHQNLAPLLVWIFLKSQILQGLWVLEGRCLSDVQSVEKRSPADGSGARPPVTLGRRDRSGRLWMWDLSSLRTCVTRASFCLYSCNKNQSSLNMFLSFNYSVWRWEKTLLPLVSSLSRWALLSGFGCILLTYGLAVGGLLTRPPNVRYTRPAGGTLRPPSLKAYLLPVYLPNEKFC